MYYCLLRHEIKLLPSQTTCLQLYFNTAILNFVFQLLISSILAYKLPSMLNMATNYICIKEDLELSDKSQCQNCVHTLEMRVSNYFIYLPIHYWSLRLVSTIIRYLILPDNTFRYNRQYICLESAQLPAHVSVTCTYARAVACTA